MNSRPMVAGLKLQLAASGVDVEREIGKGSLAVSSEQSHLLGDWEFDKTSKLARFAEIPLYMLNVIL